jgi:DNA-binding transcriptional ArsR family regulator
VPSEWDPETVFDVLGNEHARQILALASVKPVSADELAAHTDASQPTVYRRVNVLKEYDMLAEQRTLDEEGNHYKTYRTSLEEACFAVEDGGFTVEVEHRRDLVDRFSDQPPEDASLEDETVIEEDSGTDE